MFFFKLLPEDLTFVLLTDWLCVWLDLLSAVDVACCNHSCRPAWLLALSKVRRATWHTYKPICNYLQWLHDRRVHISTLDVDPRILVELDDSSPAFAVSTTAVEFHSCSHDIPFGVQRFLAYFPHLQELTWRGSGLTDHQALELTNLRAPLRRLQLDDNKLSPAVIAGICMPICNTLEDLSCDRVDDMLLWRLARCCQRITSVSWESVECMQTASLLAFFAANSHMQRIYFGGKIVTNTLLHGILAVCPDLEYVHIGETSPATIDMFTAFSNPTHAKLKQVDMLNVTVRFISTPTRVCEVATIGTGFGDYDFTCNDMDDLLGALHTPMRSLRIDQSAFLEVSVDASNICILANLHGRSLQVLDLWFDAERAEVQYFLKRCPNLVEMFLHSATAGNHITNNDMLDLPAWCPKLTKMGLCNCAVDLSDEALASALKAWSPNITVLELFGCRGLTDAFLPLLAQACPRLHDLSVRNTLFSKEALVDCVLSCAPDRNNRGDWRLICPNNGSTDWIKAQLVPSGKFSKFLVVHY